MYYMSSPVDGGRSSMSGQKGRVVNDGAVFGVVNHIHWDELRAEGHDVQLGAHRLVRLHYFRNGLPLHPPAWELEHWCPVLLCHRRWRSERNQLCNLSDIKADHTWYIHPSKNRALLNKTILR